MQSTTELASATASQDLKGTTEIAEGVVEKLVSLAASAVPGVVSNHRRSDGLVNQIQQTTGIGRPATPRLHNISVAVGREEVAVNIGVNAQFGANLAQVANTVRAEIYRMLNTQTGLRVTEVNVDIADVLQPKQQEKEHKL
ncbi:Asp23/Gls24 family envelope stress response protein [Haematomicrobium sanguinis]|uniref:Asp23/Gls24 family envelope stress response protein n=1 Tax=Haematomicrobium sanguinis TaxID=479106 RepID=UPI00047C84FC|nr:Asp23/Gls24 family envelope stress response protein [Haematomicrobium sanguinis]